MRLVSTLAAAALLAGMDRMAAAPVVVVRDPDPQPEPAPDEAPPPRHESRQVRRARERREAKALSRKDPSQ